MMLWCWYWWPFWWYDVGGDDVTDDWTMILRNIMFWWCCWSYDVDNDFRGEDVVDDYDVYDVIDVWIMMLMTSVMFLMIVTLMMNGQWCWWQLWCFWLCYWWLWCWCHWGLDVYNCDNFMHLCSCLLFFGISKNFKYYYCNFVSILLFGKIEKLR